MLKVLNQMDEKSLFEAFWDNYPRKIKKKLAKKVFDRLSAENKKKALDGLEKYTEYWSAQGTEKQFIPHASTWLNQERWEDELEGEDEWEGF